MKIHGMMLVRNEGSRLINGVSIFKQVLNQMEYICDTLTVIDDNSDDNTIEVINLINKSKCDVEIIQNDERKWDTNEVEIRKQLFEETIRKADNNDWILCLDADELFDSMHIDYLIYLLKSLSIQVDSVAFRLYDMWNNTQYRFDEHWKAHIYPWPMIIRYKKGFDYKWKDSTLHCGRFPLNASQRMLPTQIPLKHYGWADEVDRINKYNRYMRIDPLGENGVFAQYKSILDENPNLIDFGRCCIDET